MSAALVLRPLAFYVMHEDLGDEVVIATHDTFKAAQAAVDRAWSEASDHRSDTIIDGVVPEKLSIWSNRGGMLAWRNKANGWVYNVRACEAEGVES